MATDISLVHPLEARTLFTVDLYASQILPSGVNTSTGKLTYILGFSVSSGTGMTAGTTAKTVASTDTVIGNADDKIVESFAYDDLPHGFAGKLLFREASVSHLAAGSYYLGFWIDPTNKTVELDETNNKVISTSKFTVGKITPVDVTLVGTDSADTLKVTTDGSNISTIRNGKTLQTVGIASVKSLTVTGKAGDDVITIDPAVTLNVVVDGGDGNDKITGGGGADSLSGGASKDSIYGGNGNDRLNGNGGNDRLFGESGADRLYGYDGNDYLDGGSSNDRLQGDAGIDTFYGQGGDDFIYAKDSVAESIFGGSGNDSSQYDKTDKRESIEKVIA